MPDVRRALVLVLVLAACRRRTPSVTDQPPPATVAATGLATAPPMASNSQPGGAGSRPPWTPRVRERKEIEVDGVKEAWRLEWIEEPKRRFGFLRRK